MLPGSETAKRYAIFIKMYITIHMLSYRKKNPPKPLQFLYKIQHNKPLSTFTSLGLLIYV
jgi:hypothetical protein